MGEKFDVTSRLAEGHPAVDNVQNYVWACHLLGYQNPDLTLHASQVRDWYASEDGLDLSALEADCSAFEAVVAATEEALARQDDQLAAVSAAWQGRAAEASREFLRRHGEASAAAAAAVRTAADALTALRDGLWHTVDGKVATALAIDDRRLAQRADWLAAAHTVMTGAGDRATASELIDQEVKPFVDNDIGSDWLTAMRAAISAVTDAYAVATAELTAERDAVFDVPGDLGPAWTPPPRDDIPTTPAAAASSPAPVASAPASWNAPPAPTAMPSSAGTAPLIPPMPPPAAPVEPTEPAMAAPPSMPSLGGGLPDIGSGLSGFGQQLADTLRGLLGSADDALPDTAELEEPDLLDEEPESEPDDEPEEDTVEAEESVDPAADTAESCSDEQAEEPPAETPPGEPLPAEPPPPVEPPPPDPVPTPAPMPLPPEPPPPPSPTAAAETPCEIAAEELPQVGE